jgi:galactose mutarotase-like enzyme
MKAFHPEAQWTRTEREGYAAWVGQTNLISLCVIPALGSKVVSLVNRKTNREWLWRSGKPLGNGGYASSFASGDESGWDEMFPSINECVYPEAPWQGIQIPDHGEVWSLLWDDHCTGTELHCKVEGVKLPYSLEKVYSFVAEETLRIEYTLTNHSESPFTFMWAAHPLFQVHEGMKLHVSSELTEIEVSYSEGERLGVFQDKQSWPIIQTKSDIVDLSVIEPAAGKSAEKYYFVGKLGTGLAGLSDPATGEAISLRFPTDKVPYLAIWANYGAYGGHYHFAIEPATGRMDDLNHAMLRNEAAAIEANGTYRWFLEVAIT